MSPDFLFTLCGDLAVLGWLLLVFLGRVRVVAGLVAGFVFPALIGIVYGCVIVLHWHERTGGFGSLSQVHGLFENRWLLLGGWVHYLAFDLFIGAWEARDATMRQISHFLVVPCLILTFLFGPIGLLLYLTLRAILGKSVNPSVTSSSQYLA
ncbi:NhaP-type Na+/H+ or K+/H+ antiporter [Granulicella aggregans]|uniref:NhaP-type Na+/H+ or K+/H+ antiporter n=1 Tax=Granulicella aggregans TaxID=474949 RepID=A0A7W7ZI77_9BACT|nr:ABA4-like family protein [Granulicella aggregans]MBB5060414.1 NhaP-type Na+/H+ or K+/H+ antiporter [Granulicella aggregans]